MVFANRIAMRRAGEMKGEETSATGGAARPPLRERLLRWLDRIAQCCAAVDWDGAGAVGVREGAVESARAFARLLPEECLPPDLDEVQADTDGDATIGWHKASDRAFAASFDENGRTAYAGLFGGGGERRGDGRVADGATPEEILGSIRLVLSVCGGPPSG